MNKAYGILKPVGQDSKGLLFDEKTAHESAARDAANGSMIERRSKVVADDSFSPAAKACDDAYSVFVHSLNRLIDSERKIGEQSSKVSQQVRKSANEMGEGLRRIEKVADFNKLERYVLLLERAAGAMATLADLEKSGRLEKIASALK